MSRESAAHVTQIAPPSRVGRAASPADSPSPQDRAFIALQHAYRPHGGLSRLSGLVATQRCSSEARDNDATDLTQAGRLFSFRWHADLWVPMFQFDFSGTKAAAGPRSAVAELGPGFDGWALAHWFVQPNGWLAGRRPIECLDTHLPDVLEAARADRCVTAG